MYKYQTMEQIHEQFTKDWVFMINCKEGEDGLLAGGEVVYHAERKKELYKKMDDFDYNSPHGKVFYGYVGKFPEDLVLWV